MRCQIIIEETRDMNKFLLFGLLIVAVECRANITFALNLTPQSVPLGSTVTFTLDVSGLGSGTALGTYDLLVGFDPTVLNFDNVTFGTNLDPDGFGPIQLTTLNAASVELFEVSPDPDADLLALQPDAFTLATIVFDTLATGVNSPVTLAETIPGFSIGDQDANEISGFVLNDASVTVTAIDSGVPEPATILLVASGALSLIAMRKRCKERLHQSS
jgi:hypothetical protein